MEKTGVSTGWSDYLMWTAVVFVVLSILFLLYYEFKVMQIKDQREKYDFVNQHEVRYFWMGGMMVIIAIALYSNTVIPKVIKLTEPMGTYIRIFYTAGFMVVAYFVFNSLVRIIYPKYVDKRLQKIRNKPRFSPAGNPMRKLSEQEEDAHLEASQVAEEGSEIHSVDYDVWIDEKTGYKKIEKYMSYQHAEKCPECSFYTMKIVHEEIEQQPSNDSAGMMIKHFQCSYCQHREAREVVIAKLSMNV